MGDYSKQYPKFRLVFHWSVADWLSLLSDYLTGWLRGWLAVSLAD